MDYYSIIANNFQNTIETIALAVDELAQSIEQGSELMTQALLADRKIITCGNGVDAALAQLFACNLLDRFEADRPALPVLCLGTDHASVTAIAQSGSFDDIFSRQVRAFGQAGDVLLCINSGTAVTNLSRAIRTAQDRNMAVVVMSNSQDTTLGAMLRPNEDVELRVNADRQPRIVELHTMTIHNFCELIDYNLFGTYNQD